MVKNNYNKKVTISRYKLNALMNWSYDYGKNNGGETSFRRLRDDKFEKL